MIRPITLALVLAAAIPARADTIAITEFLYNAQGADDDREFVEFFNYGTDPIDMTGWTFEDANGPGLAFAFPAVSVPPSGFLIVTRNKTVFQNDWLGGQADARVLGGQPFNLNNTAAEELVVKNPSSIIVWNLGHPTPDATVGRAVALGEPEFSVTDRGTDAAPGISFSGNDPATGTLGFQRNDFTADPNQYTSTNGDVEALLAHDRQPRKDIESAAGGGAAR
ncbi:MAG: lamin tail domain-containing protein, partial [Chloroflexi bacterium]|nr:lamin tail domain-containing protein [Chloroflexota bacterium]